MNTPIRFILFCLASAFISTAHADTATSTFQVQITITKSCSVTSGTPINFGNVAASSPSVTANTSISVNCSRLTPYTVGLAPSNSDTLGAGVMSGAIGGNTDKVPYQLAKDSAGAIWGSITSGGTSNVVAGSGTGAAQSLTVYAKVANANFTPDVYTDTVTVTVTY